jgi:RNA polymerase sigma factor (sigma-70 family)
MAARTAAVLQEIVRTTGGTAGATDRELLRRFAEARDQAAFAALFRRHGGMVLGVCRRALSNVQDAEDACQATFLLLARKAGAGRWQSSLANWLYATARRVARNARVAAERRARREGRAARPEAVQPVDRLTGRELLAALDEELDKLPSHYREALILCYLQGLTRDQAARRLGVSPVTLKSHLQRGRQRLGDALTRRGFLAGAGLLVLAASSPAGTPSPRLAEAVQAAATGTASAAIARLAGSVIGTGIVNKSVGALLLLAGTAALGFRLVLVAGPAVARPMEPPMEQAPVQRAVTKPPPPMRVAVAKAPPDANVRAAVDKPKMEVVVLKAPPEAKVGAAADKPKTEAADLPPPPPRLSGRVVDPDGNPVAGAKLFVPVLMTDRPLIAYVAFRQVGTAGGDGHFKVALERDVLRSYGRVIAYSPGFGVGWESFQPGTRTGQTLGRPIRLPRDVPITGRVVNTEGKPVAGVRVSLFRIWDPGGKLDDHLARWKEALRASSFYQSKQLDGSLDGVTGTTATDRDGRFSLRGAGADRIVNLEIGGGGVVRSSACVVARPGFDPKPHNDEFRKKDYEPARRLYGLSDLYPPELTLVAEVGREVSGVVTDRDTGRPVAGCHLDAFAGRSGGEAAVSDAEGRYRLSGLPKNDKTTAILVRPPAGQDYLCQYVRPGDAAGLAPVRLDVRLAKGAVVTGRVVDKRSGKGVSAVFVTFRLLPNNSFSASPEQRSAAAMSVIPRTDTAGRFRLVAPPGPILIQAYVPANEFGGNPVSPYRRAVPDPDHKELFKPREEGGWSIATADGDAESLDQVPAVRVVDAKENAETVADLTLDRGVTAQLTVQDTDGKPLAGAWVGGLGDLRPAVSHLTGATATVYALDPTERRVVSVYHPGRHLGGTGTIRGDEKWPIVTKLSPLGRVTGRLLDTDGNPLAGATVWIRTSATDEDLYSAAKQRPVSPDAMTGEDGPTAVPAVPANSPATPIQAETDKDGRFTVDDLLPEMAFWPVAQKGEQYYVGTPAFDWLKVKPGETLDLGDRTVKPYQ